MNAGLSAGAFCRNVRLSAEAPPFPSPTAGGLDLGDVDLAHFHHRCKGAFGFSAAGRHRVRQHARRDLPGDSPSVFAPAARAFLAAVADDRFPVAIRFRLGVRRDLEGERLGLFELRPAIDSHAGYAEHGKFHGENLPFLATRKIVGRFVDGADFAVRKRLRVKARGFFRIFVEPKADGVLGFLFVHMIFLVAKTYSYIHSAEIPARPRDERNLHSGKMDFDATKKISGALHRLIRSHFISPASREIPPTLPAPRLCP